MIKKQRNGYRVLSSKRKNLGGPIERSPKRNSVCGKPSSSNVATLAQTGPPVKGPATFWKRLFTR